MNADTTGDRRTQLRFGVEEGRVVRLVGRMPFLSAREVSEILGLGGYRRARNIMDSLSALEYVTSLSVAGVYGDRWEVSRFALTVEGVRELAALDGISLGEALRRYPVSVEWRRAILRRMSALTTFYRLTAFVAEAPLVEEAADSAEDNDEVELRRDRAWFSWRRTGWLDGTIMIGARRGIRVMRFGTTLLRQSLRYRLGSMAESWKKRGVECLIIIVPGHTELGLVERWLREKVPYVQAYCVVERDLQVARSWTDVIVRRPARDRTVSLSIDVAFGRLERRDYPESVSLDAFQPYPKSAQPGAGVLGRSARDSKLLSWAQLDAVQMRALRMVADWPFGYRWRLVELGADSRALSALHRLGLVLYAWEGRHKRCVLSDAGIRCLTWIDRSRPHLWKERWAVSVVQGDEGYKVSVGDLSSSARLSLDGGSIRTVEKELMHQDQLIETCAMLAQAWQGVELIEVSPTHRSGRWAKMGKAVRSIRPDAVIMVRQSDGRELGFSVEYERRSTGTVLMDDKLSPYQSYYENVGLYESSPHGALRTLMVFSEPAGAAGFASHTLSRRDLKRRVMEIYVSSIRELRSGLGEDVWLAVGGQFEGAKVSFEQIIGTY